MDYQFRDIEKKWRQFWGQNETFKAEDVSLKPKYFILDMFPYPSGAGLHVGHPLGYIATDIISRYKRIQGFNVLHPMGYDAFGLPAEQYAIQTGQHPAITTAENISRYREQLDSLGLSYDWSREVRTSEPGYYKWTQWVFIQLFHSWYNLETDKAEKLDTLIARFVTEGNAHIKAAGAETALFTAEDWKASTEEEQQGILMSYRMAFLADSYVNWCPGLGTVLANEEVKDGLSERGGFPVERKLMRQWFLRITAYAERLLVGLDLLEWPDALKEMQRNWIGRSQGASVRFEVVAGAKTNEQGLLIEVFTTRPDTIFGCTFLVLAPEHELVDQISTPAQQKEIESYRQIAASRSERDRMSDVKSVSGAFTGAYAVNPFTEQQIPIWITDYVLAGYGTGAVMAVPSGDERDFRMASHFSLPIIPVIEGYTAAECFPGKEGKMINSGFLDGYEVKDALKLIIKQIELKGIGKGKIQYRLRDAGFSRQRYWGEPFPIFYKNGLPYTLPEDQLPLILPEVDKYLPTDTGEAPLGRAKNWVTGEGYPLETNTMPGWAGSSWYFLRYMDPNNREALAAPEKMNYWKQVDLYLGGSEHATGHLLYIRFWTKFLNDLGLIPVDEPALKLINQGMIQGRSSFMYRLLGTELYISAGIYQQLNADPAILTPAGLETLITDQLGETVFAGIREQYNLAQQHTAGTYAELESGIQQASIIDGKAFKALHVDVNLVNNDLLDMPAYRKWRHDTMGAIFVTEGGKYHCGHEVEKMSKSKLNVVNPDDLIERYGADTLRMYEMFLGPIELAKPWNTNGIEGVFKFLRRFWKLFHTDQSEFEITEEEPAPAEYKALHKIIKKVAEDIERFSFNTSVSSFMICVNELSTLKCKKRKILEPLVIVLSPFAPHITEQLWELLGHEAGSISRAQYPVFNSIYLTEDAFNYPISVNGKLRLTLNFSLDKEAAELEKEVMGNEDVLKLLDGKTPKKLVVVKGRIINIVV